MSSDANVAIPILPSQVHGLRIVEDGPHDRVVQIAGDRPDTVTLPITPDPAADHVVPSEDPLSRRADVEAKHRAVVSMMAQNGYEALALTRADSIAWFTAGASMYRDMASERATAILFINADSRAVICDNVQSARIFEEEVAGLGFQVKERAWYEDPERIVLELAHNRRTAADTFLPPCVNEMPRIRRMRLQLSRRERQVMRELGRTLSLAVEATCRNFMPGETEADVAGHLAHRLIREGVIPVDLRVCSEDRLARFRQPNFKDAPIHRRATIAIVGRRHGLCAGMTRTVSFGPVEPEIMMEHQLAAMVNATCIYFSRPGEPVREVFRRAKRIYEKFGRPDEWTLDYQGNLTGYAATEGLLMPESDFPFEADMAVRWNPSVGSARCEDTIVIDARGFEVVTEAQAWPKLEVMVKDFPMLRPGILERPPQG